MNFTASADYCGDARFVQHTSIMHHINKVGPRREDAVLDVGCGSGEETAWIAQGVQSITGRYHEWLLIHRFVESTPEFLENYALRATPFQSVFLPYFAPCGTTELVCRHSQSTICFHLHRQLMSCPWWLADSLSHNMPTFPVLCILPDCWSNLSPNLPKSRCATFPWDGGVRSL